MQQTAAKAARLLQMQRDQLEYQAYDDEGLDIREEDEGDRIDRAYSEWRDWQDRLAGE